MGLFVKHAQAGKQANFRQADLDYIGYTLRRYFYVKGTFIMAFEYLDGLNGEQRQAVITKDGFVRIIAGAGTGKTKTLIARTAFLLDNDVDPSTILLITFTKKAAKEMCDRISMSLGSQGGSKITATTFHALCANEIRRFANLVGYKNDFNILSSSDQQQVMDMQRVPVRDAYLKEKADNLTIKYQAQGLNATEIQKKVKKECKLTGFPTSKDLISIHGKAINSLMSLEQAVQVYFDESKDENQALNPTYMKDAVSIVKNFETYKYTHNMMDFDDLLMAFYRLLTEHEDIRSTMDRHFQYIMCDEYQDTNVIQDAILELLSKDVGNVCVVGDDNQSIYRFREARIENILTFASRHPGCQTIKLVQNYRSTQEILDVSNAVMKFAKEGIPKDLIGQSHGSLPVLQVYDSPNEETRNVIQQIRKLLNSGIPPREIAVLSRNSNQTFFIESGLRKEEIPFAKFGGKGFFDLKAVVGVLSIVRAACSNADELAWRRILEMLPGVGIKAADSIYQGIQVEGPQHLVSAFYITKKYADSLAGLYEFIAPLKDLSPVEAIEKASEYYCKIMEDAINDSDKDPEKKEEALYSLKQEKNALDDLAIMARPYLNIPEMMDDFMLNTPALTDADSAVTISTIHSVKGLEFHTVFLLDPILGTFPREIDDTAENREDLRCMYVALTRAKKNLVVVYPEYIEKYKGKFEVCQLSSHLAHEEVLKKMKLIGCSIDEILDSTKSYFSEI